MPVTDLERATRLWRDVIGFAEFRRGEDYVDIDSGNVVVRLIQVPAVESTLSLRLSVSNVQEAYQTLLAGGGASRYEPMKTPELEEIACVSDPDGHAIVLWRALTEDEWGFVPGLPKQGEWYETPRLVLAPAGYGPAVSRDAGVTWTTTTEGMHAGYARAVAFTTEAALVSASDGPFGRQSALYRWDVAGGGALARVTEGLPEWFAGNVDTGCLDAHRDDVALADGTTVYSSGDGGRSWTVLAADLGPIHAVALTPRPDTAPALER